MIGSKVAGVDGICGRLVDIYFDDQSWQAQYWVISLGKGKSARSVVLGMYPEDVYDPRARVLNVTRTLDQVQEAQSLNQILPVSRQYGVIQKASTTYPHLHSMSFLKGLSCWHDNSLVASLKDLVLQSNCWRVHYLLASNALSKTTLLMHLPASSVERMSAISQKILLRSLTPVSLQDDSVAVFHAPSEAVEFTA